MDTQDLGDDKIPGEEVQMSKPTGWYTAEFKAEAVRLAKSGEKSVTQTAKDLGVALESLRKWIKGPSWMLRSARTA